MGPGWLPQGCALFSGSQKRRDDPSHVHCLLQQAGSCYHKKALRFAWCHCVYGMTYDITSFIETFKKLPIPSWGGAFVWAISFKALW